MNQLIQLRRCSSLFLLIVGLFSAPASATDAVSPRYLVIRYDDYAPITPYDRGSSGIEIERRLFDLIARYQARITVGVIPFPVSESVAPPHDPAKLAPSDSWLSHSDDPWVVLLREYVDRGVIEPALHGFEHRRRSLPGHRPGEYRHQPEQWQRDTLALGLQSLSNAIHRPVRVFVPPWNAWDAFTARALADLNVEWLSPDLYHAESLDADIRLVPQTTADPAEALFWVRDQVLPPADTVIVLVTHPFDFYGPGAEAYWRSLETLLAYVHKPYPWRAAGFEDLPKSNAVTWNHHFQAAVGWERTRALLDDFIGVPAKFVPDPEPFHPVGKYIEQVPSLQDLQWSVTIVLSLTVLVAGGLAAALTVLTRPWRMNLRLAAAASAIAFIVLLIGACQIAARDYAVRGLRWQAVAAAGGLTLGLAGCAARRSSRSTPPTTPFDAPGNPES